MTRWRYIAERLRRVWTDESGFITTGAILGIVLGSAGAQAASNIYSAKKTARESRRTIETQERMEREAIAAQERAAAEDRALNQAQWDAYTKAMAPSWQTGHEAFGKLSGLLGLAEPAPFEVPGSGPGSAPGSGVPYGGGGVSPSSMSLVPGVGAKAPPRTTPGGPRFGRGREIAANVMQFPAQRTVNPLTDLRSLTDLYALAGRSGAPGGVGRRVPVQ